MIYVQDLFKRLNPLNWGEAMAFHQLKQMVKLQENKIKKLESKLKDRLPEHIQIGQGIYLYEDLEPLKTKYALKKVKEDPSKKKHFQVLEREAITPVTSAVHGMCRQSLYKNEDFKKIREELNKQSNT
ncbi:MAG: hypothetical protein ISS01_02815 [Nanoarchaeota archaeon]|nr:hypothetical protein [Nanoarchaeota archaeon]